MSRIARDRGRLNPDCTATHHGTVAAYTARCRCPHAREEWRLYNKRRREGRQPSEFVDATGSVRRVRALVALGWNFRALAREAGYSVRTVQDLGYARRSRITRHTARWVADLYERLSATPGGSKYALTVAGRYGWVPPLAWDDIDDPDCVPDVADPDAPVLDEWAIGEALAGRLPVSRLVEVDVVEAVRRLLDQGLTRAQIKYRLRLSTGQVGRAIRAAGEVAA